MTGDRKEDDGADDAATPAPPCSFAPDRIYAELGTDGAIGLIPLTPDFWPSLIEGRREIGGYLLMQVDAKTDMTHWEMHPEGDELILRLSGHITFEVETDTGLAEVALEAAAPLCLVPRGHWHRYRVQEAGQLLFVTFGRGTQHRPG